MPWLELAILIPISLVLYHLIQFVWSPPPKPRGKGMFLAAAAVALGAYTRVFRTGAPDAWAFLIFGIVMMIVAVLVIMPRDEKILR